MRLDFDAWRRFVPGCIVLGGFGLRLTIGDEVSILFDPSRISFLDGVDGDEACPGLDYDDLIDFSIGGPGAVTTGGGFIGGGFGFEGAANGMLLASALNAISSRTKVYTVIHLATSSAEAFFHNGDTDPGSLRIELAPAFVRMGRHGIAD